MITITVLFGNNNSYDIDLPDTLKLGHLIGIIPVLLRKKSKDILFIIFNGHIIGQGEYTLDRLLSDCGILNKHCNTHLVFKDPTPQYSDAELTMTARNISWLSNSAVQESPSQSQNANPASGLRDIGGMQEFLNAMGMIDFDRLEDEIVTIPEDDYHQYVTNLAADEDSTCSICQEIIESDSPDDGVMLACSHPFHDTCIRTWLTDNSVYCPTCNHDVREEWSQTPVS